MHRNHPHPKTRVCTHLVTASLLNSAHTFHALERIRHIAGSLEPNSRRARTCRSDNCDAARPKTHQNLIHTDKDHAPQDHSRSTTPAQSHLPPSGVQTTKC